MLSCVDSLQENLPFASTPSNFDEVAAGNGICAKAAEIGLCSRFIEKSRSLKFSASRKRCILMPAARGLSHQSKASRFLMLNIALATEAIAEGSRNGQATAGEMRSSFRLTLRLSDPAAREYIAGVGGD